MKGHAWTRDLQLAIWALKDAKVYLERALTEAATESVETRLYIKYARDVTRDARKAAKAVLGGDEEE